jgi:menaquinone-dependent protoporphyrinogen IX oxidase
MKILVACYSRTGRTRKAGEALTAALTAMEEVASAEFVEIVDRKNRAGAWGFVKAGKDAMFGKMTEIQSLDVPVEQYDAVVVGTPVWAATYAPAAGAFLRDFADRIQRAAFLATMRASGDRKTMRDLARVAQAEPIAELTLIDAKIAGDDEAAFLQPVRDFAGRIVKAVAGGGQSPDAPRQPETFRQGRQ